VKGDRRRALLRELWENVLTGFGWGLGITAVIKIWEWLGWDWWCT
jgi:hypothetical protein